jgi:hypothetical protein
MTVLRVVTGTSPVAMAGLWCAVASAAGPGGAITTRRRLAEKKAG